MLKEELRDKLTETLAICDLHHERMMFAWGNIKKYFPLTKTNLSLVSPVELAFFDQLIYRFSKLQDSMGSRLFKQILEALEEDISGLPFIDILYKLEKLNLLSSAKDWIVLRQIRNTVSHEYPFFEEVQIEELNLLPVEVVKLASIWSILKEYTQKRFEV
jgi:hypothetical protein